MAATYEIHPAIGIARVGPSQEFFVASEPGADPPQSYRDGGGDLLRQAAQFRVFRCERDERGGLIAATQVTLDTGPIRWTVHLANKKGAAAKFPPPPSLPPDQWPVRNPRVANRADLVIDPGARSVEGAGSRAVLDGGTFLGRTVDLGEIRTDAEGDLLVLGGSGLSQSVTPDGVPVPITHFANNDAWCDDISDGWVRAEFILPTGDIVAVEPAWVVVGPPDFAPPVFNFVTLYDVAYQAAVDRGWLAIPSQPSFTRDIYPILSRAIGYSWVTRFGHTGHGPGRLGDFTVQWAELADPQGRRLARRRILARLRDPNQPPPTAMPETAMPRLHDETNSTRVLPMTRAQYTMMLNWVGGHFVNDWPGPAPEELLPEALTRTVLQTCSGGAFFPGIEMGQLVKNPSIYVQPFRLDPAALSPGDLTKGNAVPWQADFAACEWEDHSQIGWWPAQRPDEVFTDQTLGQMREWADGAETYEDMVAHWQQLGLILRHRLPDGRELFLEQQRTLPRRP
jgi:L-lysine epsilon oxidase-like protein